MTFETFKCEFCTTELKTKSSFNYHQRTNKKCIKIQEQKNIKINTSNIFKCEFCNKNFTTKQYQKKHYEICKTKDNVLKENALKEKENELKEKEKQNELKAIENALEKEHILKLKEQIKENEKEHILKLKEQIKENEKENILKLEEQIKELQNNIKDIALKSVSTPKTTTINQNKYLFLTPFNLTKEEIKEKIEKNFTKDHFLNGQKGVADFTYNNLLLDENKQLNYFCSDTSRKFFCYKDINGEIKKDIKTKMLTNFIADDIIIKSNNICDNALADKSLKLDACHKYIIKKFDILNMKNDNNEFTATLSVLICNIPSINNNETKVEDISSDVIFEIEDEDDEECVYYTQEYFEEQEKKLQEMDKDSLYYKFFEKQLIENKIKNNIPV